jgi:hypothetical protein
MFSLKEKYKMKKEEIDQIKNNLLGQLDKFPEDKRDVIKNQIQSMDNKQVEEFVRENELTHMPGGCIFCSIIEGKSQSIKIDEDENAIAILELNPISKGHSLVVPKKHGEKVLVKVNDFAENLKKKMMTVLKPNEVIVRETKIMDHALLEVIPIYGDERERKQATQDELLETQKILTGVITNEDMIVDDSSAAKIVAEVEAEPEEIVELPERIPMFS